MSVDNSAIKPYVDAMIRERDKFRHEKQYLISAYHLGLYNGMEYAIAVLTGQEPVYLEIPKEGFKLDKITVQQTDEKLRH